MRGLDEDTVSGRRRKWRVEKVRSRGVGKMNTVEEGPGGRVCHVISPQAFCFERDVDVDPVGFQVDWQWQVVKPAYVVLAGVRYCGCRLGRVVVSLELCR